MYETLGMNLLSCAFNGIHSCLLAYGVTGSGKTYTLFGDEQNPGLIRQTIEELLWTVKSTTSVRYEITLSMTSLYNERLTDLMSGTRDNSLRIR